MIAQVAKLYITWKKSSIGYPKDQKNTIKALGFKNLNQTIVHDDSRVIRGMVGKIKHLVQVAETAEE